MKRFDAAMAKSNGFNKKRVVPADQEKL